MLTRISYRFGRLAGAPKLKTDKAQEIKKLNQQIQMVQSDMSKHREALEDCLRFDRLSRCCGRLLFQDMLLLHVDHSTYVIS